ncbi:hypothetical protein H8N03_15505 [Ramlibacter sp. USB13]|uniref:Uncharacterized protein n=1 Tax=Ramlibacter cellulosilyticus TaxID=2764187 RepID=A0A923SBZ1_9BURK|nr:hypothetical protein [Ramlibacter cellulosilyticus]MBC5784359.1 hypothetical protein [Ramlibacter cellulosilyticus]
MPTIRVPRGITPPAPGLDREEPAFVPEQDIPADGKGDARSERGTGRDERPARSPERE